MLRLVRGYARVSFPSPLWGGWRSAAAPGGGICEGNGDGFKYAIEVLIDVGVPKSHDAKSVPCELFRALPLVRQIVIKRMLSAVDLNHQAMAKADNVQDVPSNGCLSPKMKTESPQLS